MCRWLLVKFHGEPSSEVSQRLAASRGEFELVRENHRVTFEERLDRVQSNLHLVISELLAINSLCEARAIPLQRIATRLDSAVLLFLGELRTAHDLLYQPRLLVEEGVLGSILANLASALDVLAEGLTCLPPGFCALTAVGNRAG
jgi:hypothetical protein